jgi:hypothetical protein
VSEPISLYIAKNRLWAAANSLGAFALGDLFYGDVLSFRAYILSPNPATANNHPEPWTLANLNDLSLKFAIGDLSVADVMTPVVAQNSWSKDSDNRYFYADVSLATTELKTALNGLTSIQRYLEIKQSKGGYDTTIYQQLVTLRPRAIGPTTVVPIPPDQPISKAEANGTFQPRIGENGAVLRLPSANGLWATDLFTDNDGNWRTEQVTGPF